MGDTHDKNDTTNTNIPVTVSDETLLLTIVICLAITHAALPICQFLHHLLLKEVRRMPVGRDSPRGDFEILFEVRWASYRVCLECSFGLAQAYGKMEYAAYATVVEYSHALHQIPSPLPLGGCLLTFLCPTLGFAGVPFYVDLFDRGSSV